MKMQNEVMFSRQGLVLKMLISRNPLQAVFNHAKRNTLLEQLFQRVSQFMQFCFILLFRKVYVSLSLKRYQCKKIR